MSKLDKAWKAYKKAIAEARIVFEEAKDPAWTAYQKAIAPARAAHEKAVAKAQAAFTKVRDEEKA